MQKYFISNLKGKFLKKLSFQQRNFATLVIPEISNGIIHSSVLNLTQAATQLDKDIHILAYGEKVDNEIINQVKNIKGVTKILVYNNPALSRVNAENLSLLTSLVNENYKYDNILAGSTNFGKNFLPRVGGLLDVQPLSDVAKIESQKIFHRYFYAGNAVSRVESLQKPNILTIRLTSFDKIEQLQNNAEVIDISTQIHVDFSSTRQSKFLENIESKSEKVDLGSAKVVISGGRALKSKENFALLENLVNCFDNCAIGASRAAVDAGYVSNDLQVGQTGKTVAPDLYFAIGISGAIQHVAGMKDSKVIVAINTDPDAAIFNIATYGLVGDLFKIIPELTEKIKKATGK